MRLFLAFITLLGAISFAYAAFSPNTYPVIDVVSYGAVGDGTTNNNTAFTNAFAAAQNGGMVRVPCGKYKLTSTISAVVASGKHIEFAGSGQDCTVIFVSGAVNGPTFTYTDQWSSVKVSDMTIETDQAGGTSCLVWSGAFVNPASAYSASSAITDVTIRGNDVYTGTTTHYCGIGFNEDNISNINITNYTYQGKATSATTFVGKGITLTGAGAGTYSVAINIINATINNCDTGIVYDDWVQGVSVVSSNITGCGNGMIVVAAPSGSLDELAVVNTQINTFSCGICVNDTLFNDLELTNNTIITEINSIGVKVQGTNWIISGNEFGSTSTTGTQAILVNSTYGNGGSIIGNHIANYGAGIQMGAASSAVVKVDNQHFSGNTADYVVNAAARGIYINDSQPRNFSTLPTCGAQTAFAMFTIVDSPSIVFNATVVAGGGANYVGLKCDGTRYYVD